MCLIWCLDWKELWKFRDLMHINYNHMKNSYKIMRIFRESKNKASKL